MIREELGETNVEDEADEFMEKLKNLKASDEVKEKLKKRDIAFSNNGKSDTRKLCVKNLYRDNV